MLNHEKANSIASYLEEITANGSLIDLADEQLFVGYTHDEHTNSYVIVYDDRLEDQCRLKAALLDFHYLYNLQFNNANDLLIVPAQGCSLPKYTLKKSYFVINAEGYNMARISDVFARKLALHKECLKADPYYLAESKKNL